MILAVFDKFTDFVVATSQAYSLLIVGVVLSLLGMAGSFLMLRSVLLIDKSTNRHKYFPVYTDNAHLNKKMPILFVILC